MLKRIVVLAVCAFIVTFAAVPIYTVGDVPPQTVDQGEVLSFQLRSPRVGAATFSYAVDARYPRPSGHISLNATSGLFTYTPAAADKFQLQQFTWSRTATNKKHRECST